MIRRPRAENRDSDLKMSFSKVVRIVLVQKLDTNL